MSKNNQNSFDNGFLNINKEINEQIGKIKTYTYARIQRNSKNKTTKNEKNKNGQKKFNSKDGDNYYDRKNSKDNYNNNSSHKKNENINVLRAKVVKKKNFDHIERVVIDLYNSEDVESVKTESIPTNNIYDNESIKDKYNSESNEILNNNKDNNISHSINNILIAMNMIESRWKNNCSLSKEKDLNFNIICNEIDKNKREIEILLNRWKNNKKIMKEDKLSIFSDDNNNIINKWKKNNKNIKEINLSLITNKVKSEPISWNANNYLKMIKTEKLSFFIDDLKIKEKEMNNLINRWLNNNKCLLNGNISYLVDEITKKKNEIERIKFKWNNESKTAKSQEFSFIVDNSLIYEKNIKNNIDRWNNQNKYTNIENMSFLIDIKELKEKELNKWINISSKENNISFSYEAIKDLNNFKYFEEKYINNLIENISISENNKNNYFILNYDSNLHSKSNKINYKIIKPDNKNDFQSILYSFYNENKKNTEDLDLNKDNNLSQRTLNQNSHFTPIFILNDEQIKQLYEEFNKEKDWKDELIISNNMEIEICYEESNKEKDWKNELIISNNMEIEICYEESNKEKDWKNELIISNKEIEICYEVIKSNTYENNIKNKTQFEKGKESLLRGGKKMSQDFGETTPLAMLKDKFHIYAISRNIKYCIESPQINICYINNKHIKKGKNVFANDKIKINHFSLSIEKLDNSESYRSS